MTTYRQPAFKFTADVSYGGQQILNIAAVFPGCVAIVEDTSNPNFGGIADMGRYTFAQVLAGEMDPNLPSELVADITAYVRTLVAALEALLAAVRSIGDSNDAFDHGQGDAAARILAAAPARTREAWALASDALERVIPEELVKSLSTGSYDPGLWYELANQIELALRGPSAS